jgi:hypothetical protein
LFICSGGTLRKIVLFKIGSKSAELPKFIGSFLIVVSILMLINAGASVFDAGIAAKDFDKCVEMSGVKDLDLLSEPTQILAQLRYQDCKNSFYQLTGAQVPGGQNYLTTRQFLTAFTGPVGTFFLWAIVFLFALFLFNNASIVVPVEQVEIPLNVPKTNKKSSKKKKK